MYGTARSNDPRKIYSMNKFVIIDILFYGYGETAVIVKQH